MYNTGTGTLENADEWYDWVAGILNTIYLDATCGKPPQNDDFRPSKIRTIPAASYVRVLQLYEFACFSAYLCAFMQYLCRSTAFCVETVSTSEAPPKTQDVMKR
jgi:hypothetical protein